MSLTIAKVAAMFLTGVIPIICGLIPMKANTWLRSDNIRHQIIVSSLLCYGGGILFGVSILHMLPEVRETLEKVFPKESALAETFLCSGFFMIYIVEELVHSFCDHSLQHDHCEDDHTQSITVHRAFSTQRNNCEAGELGTETTAGESSSERRPSSEIGCLAGNNNGCVVTNANQITPLPSRVNNPAQSSVTPVPNYRTFSNHGSEDQALVPKKSHQSSVRDFLTVLALSLHAVFEGLAVGLEDSVVTVWTLYAAVAMHKYILAFCVGLELFTSKNNLFIVNLGYILVFSIMSPLGIGIGIAVTTLLTEDDSAYNTTVGVLQGLAAGTLLYVVVFEVLQREKAKEKVPGLIQLLFVLAGFATMLLFVRYGPACSD